MQRDLSTLLPDYLASSVEPGFIKDGVLTLFAGHNALAARLRHIEPRLLADLQQRGWAVNSLKIRVRPQPMQRATAPKQARMSRRRRRCVAGTRRIARTFAASGGACQNGGAAPAKCNQRK